MERTIRNLLKAMADTIVMNMLRNKDKFYMMVCWNDGSDSPLLAALFFLGLVSYFGLIVSRSESTLCGGSGCIPFFC